MSRPMWFVELVKRSFPSRFQLAKLTHVPGIGHLVDQAFFAGDAIIYLPKDNVIPVHEPIAAAENVVLPSDVVAHFVEQAAHRWIMDFCICREASGCTDYPRSYGCLFLGEAVHKINPALGHLASKEEALDHLARCREAGLVHMVGRNKLDTIWLGANPGRKLLTICNCCPCCCLWRVLPVIDQSISRKVTRMPGVSVTVTSACKGCKLCVRDVCFVDAIHMNGKQAVVDPERCRGCGRCVSACPLNAIELKIGDSDYMEQAIGHIAPLVDLT